LSWPGSSLASAPVAVGAGLLEFNAHASFAPDGRWLLLDRRAPQTSGGDLLLCDLPARRCLRVARFPHDERMAGPLRCDLHPRWSRDGTRICVDAVRDGLRQVVLLDVGDVVGRPAANGGAHEATPSRLRQK